MDSVVHFEMAAEDIDRMSDFYSKTFGWGTNKLGPDMGNYVVVTTAETDENRMVKQPGAINGGFYKRTKPDGQDPRVVIAVQDIQASMKKVEESGGKVLGGMQGPDQPDDIPGVGLYITIEDTEGNKVGMLQPNPRQ